MTRGKHTVAIVTGAGGFIGGHLVRRLLEDGRRVTAVDKKPLTAWEQDPPRSALVRVRDLQWVRDLSPELVGAADEIYHLAADMGGVEFTSTQHLATCDNIVDTLHLARYASPGTRLFYASTACVYPVSRQAWPDAAPLRETDVWPYDPEPGYGFEKLFGEHALGWAALERDLRVRVARYHNVYGPHGTWRGGREKAPAALCRKVAEAVLERRDAITIFGDGEQTRTFTYVDDAVEGTCRITDSDVDVPLNLGTSELVSINYLAALVAEIAGRPGLRVEHNLGGPQGVRGRSSDNKLIRDRLWWEPTTPLATGLAWTYEWVYNQVKAARR